MMTLSHIVAAAENNIIGVQGELPWDIPEDMKFFRDTTKGKILIMGRKTFESVGHPLPKRLNIVVSRNPGYQAEGAICCSSIEEGIEEAKKHTDTYGDEVFIIGGGEIYKQSLPLVDTIYLTRIHKTIEGDASYPSVPDSFIETNRTERTEPVPFTFLTYKKKTV